mmetsp:Transcript_39713/g.97611  ORF Transcript_39713/g.97611 Transcript_39713/m.97611 type:complete len:279 (-) Transcript_39713:448-1284(-)|eukprot:CAMPEP_0206235098 /NCGR_PEP_ID=MMETSP0047_2-20121206/12960_1 /ASSEMBLY_ACC=CAM_ASM_000192 /TAXON_ID=195065 /ORGANISM="Chroomonas mesostigmatica_cf, Strain CCMP1168" /LENGTH=278 /DNA_ID=CAMNT_0053659263 /DNA_START=170 /DNA_END=1006 /DNA_ORIENTATION=+
MEGAGRPQQKQTPCIFFRKGTCKNGDGCAFSHDPNLVVAAAPPREPRSPAAAPKPYIVELLPGVPYVSIDVECVATSKEHNGRATAQIALVSHSEQPILNLYVKPEGHVESYLEPLTGLSKALLDEHGMTLAQAMTILRQHLPKNSILVGQNIEKDVEWLQLQEGTDFQGMVDLSALFRVWNDRYKSFTYFGLDHASTVCLGQANDGAAHNAVSDAVKSMQLFNLYCRTQSSPEALTKMHASLLSAPVAPSFAKLNPSYEGCCMGNRKTCTCGAPFFS